ncbi:Na(+)-translocating NADH-quinone reductase subunit F [Flavobacterium sp. NRK F10]|uniref:Na(+)-translocating NADH-quinone reductase subunit F n=1 Tax=Flavobacterium sp. NRK F10 TaxID=2954931 RepID=UPI002091805F|nr:Na(+)-translocating NADH-quinone reductase subunit F [Flavobacterium sp. NRK F10]MCO6176416.1 Na(+)-translocating NADH-quinone reductase subunit F [Flavobacterium sp. NRK F10]
MKTTDRLDMALNKLYKAFHNDTLHPECCNQCAVGNILDHNDFWKNFAEQHGTLELNYLGRVHEQLGRKFNGYSPSELLLIEHTFLNACGYQLPLHYKHKRPDDPKNKDILFDGLSAVVSLLCQLDGISDVMDCSDLFQYEKKNTAIKKSPTLQFI